MRPCSGISYLQAAAGTAAEDSTLLEATLGLFITARGHQIPFERFRSPSHPQRGIPQFNYAFRKQIFPSVDFKTAS